MPIFDPSQSLGSLVMKPQSTFSPVSLRYIAALRGNKPKRTGQGFTYAEVACRDAEKLICLAASNPEGRFYGLVADENARRAAEEKATQRGTFNVVFLVGSPSETLARLANGSSLPPMLDYLCCDSSAEALAPNERIALFDLAGKRLNPGGLFAVSYRAYDRDDGALRFIVQQFAPQMNDDQKQEFLLEIKRLATRYLAKHRDIATRLDEAILKRSPQSFFELFDGAPATSGSFDTLVEMGPRGLLYAGDANLTSNYAELAVPAEAQPLVIDSRNNYLYEPIKDLAMDRTLRSDIWVKTLAEQSDDPAQLYGGFAYGITVLRDQVPLTFSTQGTTINLSESRYTQLLDLMAIMPVGVGDILTHPAGAGETPARILEALQILVACGIASPMRGQLSATNQASVAQPRLVGNFNRFLDKTDLSDRDVLFASQVMGCPIALSAREAFVMQALNRVGLANSLSALMPEFTRLAGTPAAQAVFQADQPTEEKVHALICDVVGKSLPQWYAYALLEAA